MYLTDINAEIEPQTHEEWVKKVVEWKKEYPLGHREVGEDKLLPQEVLKAIDDILQGDTIVVTDVGQHQMWAAQYFTYKNPDSIVTSGGAGTMGFGLPAAIGAQIGAPDKKVVLIVGDGGFQMTLQELMMIKQYNLPIKSCYLEQFLLGNG